MYGLSPGDVCDIYLRSGSTLRGLRFHNAHKQGGVLTFTGSDGTHIFPISAIDYITHRSSTP